MNELTTINTESMSRRQELQQDLFTAFVRYIDRGEATTRAYLINLRQFAAWLRYSGITAPTREDIISYRQYLLQEHPAIQLDAAAGWAYRKDNNGNTITIQCKPTTAAQYLRSVCQFFTWTAAEGFYPNVAANIHAPKINHDTHKKDALTAEDVRTIERSIDRTTEQGKRLYAMFTLMVNAGLRTVEVSRACVKDLETKNGQSWLYIWGKGHAEADQKKAIAAEVKAAIDDYLNARTDKPNGSSPLFVSTGNRSGGQRIAPTTISTMIKTAMVNAGIDSPRITAHSLRHTAGTQVQEITGNLYDTQQYMRHANPATTEIYLHTDTEKQDAAIAQRLYNHYHGKDNATQLADILKGLTPAQLEQIAGIAKLMTA